ncbi:MAG: hypothetical protein HY707_07265 [Ignavibacteriae bacterium]|nr:hypothetical protein [Ignavibacteriota bacterium]
MRTAQVTLREFIGVYRLRKKLLFIPLSIVTILSILGAFTLQSRYEATTTILVQREDIPNPLLSYELSLRMGEDDRLRTFDEIISSRITIKKLIDSLGLGKDVRSEAEEQAIVENVRSNIQTERKGSDSFSITYTSSDPYRTQRAASLLANFFIETILQVKNQRNDLAVQFYEKKLEEIRKKFETSQKKVVSALHSRLGNMPVENRILYTQIENLDRKIGEFDSRIKEYQQGLGVLRTLPKVLHAKSGKQTLYDLQRTDVPFAADLRTLLTRYDEYIRRYTVKYPEVEKLESQIIELLGRMRSSMESELTGLQSERLEFEKQRTAIIAELKESSVQQRIGDVESDFDIYKKLYDEMTLKLEQAQTTRDLGEKGASHFIIIDPAVVPTRPTKPNRSNIILGGFGLGLFLGIVAMALKELLDTTLRGPRDIEIYEKPVIALITDGGSEKYN